jgi:hypothetical protein
MTEQIKLNLPCWICHKELFLGQGIVTFPIESLKSPAHLECLKKQWEDSYKKLKEKNMMPIHLLMKHC